MKKLLNTLYVTLPEAYLSRDGLNVVVKVEDEERLRVPIHNLENIIFFGYKGVSPSLLELCSEHRVSISLLSPSGKFYGRFTGPVRGNVLLRRQQFRLADDTNFKVSISKVFIMAKIYNSRHVIYRALRDHGDQVNREKLLRFIKIIDQKLRHLEFVNNLDQLRGIEGDAANEYFGVFNELIVAQKEDFRFDVRTRRPPRDRVNAMLSFCYMLLLSQFESALEAVGLDPYVGFLHADRPGKPSLALDLMEELRPYLADRLVVTMINRRQVHPNGFKDQEGLGVLMTEATIKEIINTWQQRKHDEITHPYLQEKIPVGLLPYVQAQLLAKYIRGELDNYPAFLMK